MQTINFDNDKVTPGKVVCVGRNYVEHAQELGNDIPQDIVFFVKPNSAIGNTLYSHTDEPLHYEAELCFLIKNNVLFGVGLGLDLTKRTLQSKLKEQRLPWERAKSFDGAALFSDFVPLPGAIERLRFEMAIDGECIQSGNIDLMLNKPAQILTECLSFMSLQDGDIIMTGTPKGVGKVTPGSSFDGRVFYGDDEIVKSHWTAQ